MFQNIPKKTNFDFDIHIEIRPWIGHYIFGRLRDIQIFGPEKVTIFLIFYKKIVFKIMPRPGIESLDHQYNALPTELSRLCVFWSESLLYICSVFLIWFKSEQKTRNLREESKNLKGCVICRNTVLNLSLFLTFSTFLKGCVICRNTVR
jgi:hypothetical protein